MKLPNPSIIPGFQGRPGKPATSDKSSNVALEETKISTMNPEEAYASLRVLVHLAKADGRLSTEEKLVLQEALKDALLPVEIRAEALLEEDINMGEQLFRITSSEGRERTYNAAYTLAHLEGNCSKEEQKLLNRIREGLHISKEKATLLGRVYFEAKDAVWPEAVVPITNPTEREQQVNEDVMKYAIVSAVIGGFPVPVLSVVTDLLIISLQVKLVRDIGQYWGHKVDRAAARSLVGSILGASGLRIAVHSLLNVIPGWGSMFGAATAFGATWALGTVAHQYFENGAKMDAPALRELFEKAKVEAKGAYEKSKDVIAAKIRSRKATLELLEEDVRTGAITQEEYAHKMKELG